jgi:hypothetical protein
VFQVPIKWPQSREEVWKVNIPHTHLAHEKSDQNWMVVKGEKIFFPGGGTHFHHGADKYIAAIANVRRTVPLNCLSCHQSCVFANVYRCHAMFILMLLNSGAIA